MANTKAPKTKKTLDPESESWNKLPWRKFEQQVYRIQKRIFKAKQQGKTRAVQRWASRSFLERRNLVIISSIVRTGPDSGISTWNACERGCKSTP